jgi:hypothetical protein
MERPELANEQARSALQRSGHVALHPREQLRHQGSTVRRFLELARRDPIRQVARRDEVGREQLAACARHGGGRR